MGNDVKNAGQFPEGQNPALNKEKTFGIRLRVSRWNTLAAAAVLAVVVLSLYGGGRVSFRSIFIKVLKNPLILSTAAGLLCLWLPL